MQKASPDKKKRALPMSQKGYTPSAKAKIFSSNFFKKIQQSIKQMPINEEHLTGVYS